MNTFLQTIYPIAKILSPVFFGFINFLFECYYFFQSRQIVPSPEDELLLLSVTDAAELIRQRKLTSTKLISSYISRIKLVNPIINAVVEDNFVEAIKEAEKVDKYLDSLDDSSNEYKMLSETKPLLGIPFTIKDTFAVKGLRLTAGIVARKNCISETDAEVVERVKEAGAICLAITNVPESARHVECNNEIYGKTKNPYDSRRTSGGSSGGEGALIASAGSIFGIGSDLCGSIRCPAAFNGIFGLKPSEDSVPIKGHYPFFTKGYPVKMCYVGPLCRYAKDLSLLFRVMSGNDEIRFKLSKPVSMNKIRFFYSNGLNSTLIEPLNSEVKKSMEKCINYFEKKYDTFVDRINFEKLQYIMGIYFTSLSESRDGNFSHVLKQTKKDINIGTEFIKKLFGKSDHAAFSLINLLLDKHVSVGKESQQFFENIRDKLRNEIIELLKDDGILIFPAWPTLAPFHSHLLVGYFNKFYSGIWNALRLPAITCPIGFNEAGLPLSVQLIASPDNDRLLIAAANDLEQGFGGWKTPF